MADTTQIRIPVSQAGIYRVDFSSLNLPAPVSSVQLHLTNRGSDVALLVQDGGDGVFGPGDSFLFYGMPLPSTDAEFQYTGQNAYMFSVNGAAPLRMTTRTSGTPGIPETSFRDTQHSEVNLYYWQTMPSGGATDHWFWGLPIHDHQQVTLPAPTDPIGSNPYTVRVRLYGQTAVVANPDHDTTVTFNGLQLGEVTWDGQTPELLSYDAPESASTSNTVTIAEKLASPSIVADSILLDWIEIDYDRAFKAVLNQLKFTLRGKTQYSVAVSNFYGNNVSIFDITDPTRPVAVTSPAITGAGPYTVSFADTPTSDPAVYMAVADVAFLPAIPVADAISQDLKSTDNGADYVIVTHPDLKASAQALADYRASQGYRVKLVTTQEIYDQFSNGLFTPEAIRGFLKYAQQNWIAPAPKFVVLIGDANLDYHDYLLSGQATLVPTFMVDTSVGQTTSDAHFVQLADGDPLPKMLIGRIPAKTPAQVRQVVQRIIAYETDKSAAAWKSRVMVASGDQDPRFKQYAEEWLGLVPAGWNKTDIPLADYALGNKQAAESAFDNVLTNLGAGLVTYFGHGSPDSWVPSNNFYLITSASLTPPRKFASTPIFIGFNCLNSLFAEPAEGETLTLSDGSQLTNAVPLAEALLFSPDAAAIAMWSPSALAYPSEQRWIGQALFKAIFQQKVTTLGEATTQALTSAYKNSGISAENFDVFTLIGDPATKMALIEPSASAAPVASSGSGGGGGGEFLLPAVMLLFWLGGKKFAR